MLKKYLFFQAFAVLKNYKSEKVLKALNNFKSRANANSGNFY